MNEELLQLETHLRNLIDLINAGVQPTDENRIQWQRIFQHVNAIELHWNQETE